MTITDADIVKKDILKFLPANIKKLLLAMDAGQYEGLEEIRLRNGQPLILRIGARDFILDTAGKFQAKPEMGYIVKADDIYRTIASISDNSLYAFEAEIGRGYITVPGGHRVGLAGQVILSHSQIKTIKNFSGIAFRIAREIKGCASSILDFIYSVDNGPGNTLIVSAPGCGKTTILRDIARCLSNGNSCHPGCNVTIVDERSEIAGTYLGQPQMDIGIRTDVLDACPKAAGMVMAVRSLAPQVVVTDEIGRSEDIEAIRDCLNAGVTVITSVHGRDIDQIKRRPLLNELLNTNAFVNLVVLSRRHGPGTLEQLVRWETVC